MQRSKRITGVALSIALLAALAIPASAKAQGQSMEVELTPSRGSGVSGTAALEDVGGRCGG